MAELTDISLSVSIVCYDSSEQELHGVLKTLLASLAEFSSTGFQLKPKLFFVDNSESHRLDLTQFDQFADQIDSVKAELRLLKGHGNIGFGKGHNLVINSSTDKYHLILNPDVELEPRCLIEGITFLEKNTEVAIASPFAVSADGKRQFLCKRFPAVTTLLVRGLLPNWLKKYFHRSLASYEMRDLSAELTCDTVPLVSGCFMLCRTENLHSVKGFDENYFMYFEDFDLSLRLGLSAKLAYLPSMRIKHFGGHAGRRGLKHFAMFVRSGIRFFNTYGWRLIQ